MADDPSVTAPAPVEEIGESGGTMPEIDGGPGVPGTGAMPISGGTTDPNVSIAFLGTVGVTQTTTENNLVDGVPNSAVASEARPIASLIELAEPFPLSEYLERVVEQRDRCTRYLQGAPVEGFLADADAEFEPPLFVDGGQVLTIRSPQGSYAELVYDAASNAYGGRDVLPVPVPDGLVADIPGARFPAVPDITIPAIDPLVVLGDSPAGVLDLTFVWEAGGDPSALVVLGASTISADDESNGFLCSASDDGEFIVPDWAAATLTPGGVGSRTLMRNVTALTVHGNTLVVGSSLSSYASVVTGTR